MSMKSKKPKRGRVPMPSEQIIQPHNTSSRFHLATRIGKSVGLAVLKAYLVNGYSPKDALAKALGEMYATMTEVLQAEEGT